VTVLSGGSAAWETPELTGIGRVPMHSVSHPDRVDLDGRWRFQLLPAPDADPSFVWGEIEVPGCWTMQGWGDLPHYTNVVMPFAGLPPRVPDANPTGLYEREVEIPARWAGRRIVLHVGAAESVLIARVNGREVGISKDSHLAAEFDVTDVVAVGANTISLTVVKWSDASYIEDQDQWWHGGITRSVTPVATGRPTWPTCAGHPGRRPRDRDARGRGRRRSQAARRARAGASRSSSPAGPGQGSPSSLGRDVPRPPTGRRPSRLVRACRAGRADVLTDRRAGIRSRPTRRSAAETLGRPAVAAAPPGRDPGVALVPRSRPATPWRSTLLPILGTVVERRRLGRLPPSRWPGTSCS
jgi:hypothetical protein